MGSVNADGVYVYDGFDQLSPLPTLLNLQSSALSAVTSDLDTRMSTIEVKQEDSGWINIDVEPGFSQQGSAAPQVRRIGNIVYARWGWDSANIPLNATTTVGTIPSNLWPPGQSVYGVMVTNHEPSERSARFTISANDGLVQIMSPSSAVGYYLFQAGTCWFLD